MLGAITALGPLTIDFYLPALPQMTRDLASSESMVQLTLTASVLGLAIGQALLGPTSDVLGRRTPLLAGLALYALASAACALAPNVGILVAARFVQALAGAAGQVVARAIVRDLVSGREIARLLSLLMLVTGAAPILAPVLGGQMVGLMGWRGIFWLLAVFGVALGVVVAVVLPETLAAHNRRQGGPVAAVHAYVMLLKDRAFVGYALVGGIGFAAMFAYLSGSSFVYQQVFGVSPQWFGVLFGMNGLALVACSQLNRPLVRRFPVRAVLTAGQTVGLVGGLLLLVVAAFPFFGLPGVVVALILAVGSRGLVMPNCTALCLNRHPDAAGSASALMGTMQFGIGAAMGPLVTLNEVQSAMPMAIVMTAAMLGAFGAAFLIARPAERRATATRPAPG